MSIQTSIGTSTATSYVGVASANTYFRALESGILWDKITAGSTSTLSATARKENLLKQATREIDNTYRFHQSKYNKGTIGQTTYQALEFPRDGNVDANNSLFIPDEVKWAAYEQTGWILQRGQQRYTQDGTLVDPPLFSNTAYNYIRGWINRGIKAVGRYGWQG